MMRRQYNDPAGHDAPGAQAVLAAYDPGFCWAGLGAALLAQGPVAYMADVRPVSTMRVEKSDIISAP